MLVESPLNKLETTLPPEVFRENKMAALRGAIKIWASASTSGNARRRDELIQKKKKSIENFFSEIEKDPGEVESEDVQRWCENMKRGDGKAAAAATVYARVSFLSSFYAWAERELGLRHNPTLLARPKAPKPYQTEASKAWSDEELRRITDYLLQEAARDNVIAKRDLSLLLIFTSTGMRREEVIGLRGSDVEITETGILVKGLIKGGRYRTREVNDLLAKKSLMNYLAATDRLHVLQTEAPLWTRHDQKKFSGQPLTSHAFVRNLKIYARRVGLDHVHLHQTRHTFARIVAEETGSMAATQDALDHANLSTTMVYVRRLAVKRDLYSAAIARRRQQGTINEG